MQHKCNTAIPRSMVINTQKLLGVTKKVQLITMATLITMSFQMVLISWVNKWPQNRPKRTFRFLSVLDSCNFIIVAPPVGQNWKLDCYCFLHLLALFFFLASAASQMFLRRGTHFFLTFSVQYRSEGASFHFKLARLQPLIVHPGFGHLQKILQVKYSLVAKEWVSDSKIF